MKKLITTLAAALSLGASAYADYPTNIGFETGDTSGWQASGNYQVVSSYTNALGDTTNPAEGAFFALLEGGEQNVASTLSQTFWLDTGDVLTGYAGFFADDYLPFNDEGAATLTIGNGGSTLFYADVSSVGGQYGNTGWVPWTYTALSGGLYTLTYSATNRVDSGVNSHAYFDTSVSAGVPDTASTLGLFALGFAGIVAVRRRLIKA